MPKKKAPKKKEFSGVSTTDLIKGGNDALRGLVDVLQNSGLPEWIIQTSVARAKEVQKHVDELEKRIVKIEKALHPH